MFGDLCSVAEVFDLKGPSELPLENNVAECKLSHSHWLCHSSPLSLSFYFLRLEGIGVFSEASSPVDGELDEHEFCRSHRLDTDACAELVAVDHVWRIQFGVCLDDEGVDTVGGLMAKQLGIVPIPGASVEISDWTLTAESTAGRRHRIDTVLISRDNFVDNTEVSKNDTK